MLTARRSTVLLAAFILVSPLLASIDAQRINAQKSQVPAASQSELAQQLLGPDPDTRMKALADIRALGPEKIGPELRAALINALDRENRVVTESRKRGEITESVSDPNYHSRLCETVTDLRSAAAIRSLATSMGTCGFVLHRHLARFGEPAAQAVLSVVMDPNSHYDAVNEGLIALRFMVEAAQDRPLSPPTLQRIAAAAAHHMTVPGRPAGTGVTLRRAIDLAAALGDPQLRRTIEAIASNASEVVARGVTDPQLIEQTQQRARDRLAGIPAPPRR